MLTYYCPKCGYVDVSDWSGKEVIWRSGRGEIVSKGVDVPVVEVSEVRKEAGPCLCIAPLIEVLVEGEER